VVFFQEDDGTIPFFDWFGSLDEKARDKCRIRLERLRELGHEIRRPEADLLRDGIYELRAKHQKVNYRMLYFFHLNEAVVISHGVVKQQAVVPTLEIDRALERKRRFLSNPEGHTHGEMI